MGLTNNLGKLSNMITSTGSAVGIAQSSPSYTLDVTGTGRYTSTLDATNTFTLTGTQPNNIINYTDATSYARFYFTEGSTYKGTIQFIGSNFVASSRRNNLEIVNSTTGDIAIGTGDARTFFIKNGGNVLINGTTSTNSAALLQVFGSTTVSTNNGQIRINDSATTTKTMSLGVDGTNNVGFIQSFQDGVAYRSLILNGLGGNVGIGTTAPDTLLHIYKAAYPIFTIQGSGYQSSLGIDTSSGSLVLNNQSNAALAFNTNNTERMRITSGGAIGMNTSSPDSTMVLTLRESSSLSGALALINRNNTKRFDLIMDIASVDDGAFGIYDRTAGAYRQVITSGGNVLIGTTSDSGNAKLQVNGGIYAVGTIIASYASVNVTANTPLYWNNSNGQIGINTSSIRYKTDIVSLTKEQAEIALKLNPVEYTRIETGERELGFIAEEVKEAGLGLIVPEINGEVITIDYAKLSVIAIAMIKEQQKQIEELKLKIK